MCGIIGYTGSNNAVPYLIKGLKKLEYRGYDSAGIAGITKKGIKVIKSTGRVENLEKEIDESDIYSNIGIGHTRWATHGEVTDRNAHPHISYKGKFAIVHNGIIENYSALREKLRDEGYAFLSDTDSEVIAHLLERDYNGDIISTIMKMSKQIEGTYALAIISIEHPDEIILTKKGSPLIIGKGEGAFFASSDINGICSFCSAAVIMNEEEIAIIKKDSATFYLPDGNEVYRKFKEITVCESDTEKGIYSHYMLKEIYEQPESLRHTLSFLKEENLLSFLPELIKNTDRIYLCGCGSAYHAAFTGKLSFEKLTKTPSSAEIASEFRYADMPVNNKTLFIAISQSGETADTLFALRKAKEKGAFVLSIVNTTGSSIERESDQVIHTKAGPEIAVATTKAYSCQLTVLYYLAVTTAKIKNNIGNDDFSYYIDELHCLPEKIENILSRHEEEIKFAKILSKEPVLRFIGRNTDFAGALEGSLKMKEITYIPSESYPAGELKHGTISLIEKNSIVISLMCNDALFKKTAGSIEEIRSRGGDIIIITTEKHTEDVTEINKKIIIPDTDDLFVTVLETVVLQLLAYYTALEIGRDIDKPRNLAKSVTVE